MVQEIHAELSRLASESFDQTSYSTTWIKDRTIGYFSLPGTGYSALNPSDYPNGERGIKDRGNRFCFKIGRLKQRKSICWLCCKEKAQLLQVVAQAQAEEPANMPKRLNEDHVTDLKASMSSTVTNIQPAQSTKKSAAAIAAEVVDKLAASSSSQYIMTCVLATFAAEEAKNAGLVKSSTSSTSFTSVFSTPMSKPVSDQTIFMPAQQPNPPQNNQYQPHVVRQPSIEGHVSNSYFLYHSLPKTSSQQYLQPPGRIVDSYDYGSLPPLPLRPPPETAADDSTATLMMGHQPSTLSQQQAGPSSTSSTSFTSVFSTPMSKPVSDQTIFMPTQQPNPPQNIQYQSHVVRQPSIEGHVSNSYSLYHSLPKTSSQQYLQPPGRIVELYDYGSLPPLPPRPPPETAADDSTATLMMGHQPSTLSQQQTGPVPQQPHATPS
ncbi:unnamed protein product [Fraxinus pennsylvanica]|uniref:Uncharacterized protein n=1 Tax=Fraxinus pennsylvanica TaxID=56036 RepID=A0AAD1Z5U9_9LAMI|nr:unnamed protein product [Fraxinus pennsylvanica]